MYNRFERTLATEYKHQNRATVLVGGVLVERYHTIGCVARAGGDTNVGDKSTSEWFKTSFVSSQQYCTRGTSQVDTESQNLESVGPAHLCTTGSAESAVRTLHQTRVVQRTLVQGNRMHL